MPYGVIKIFLYENLIDKSGFTCQPGEHVSITWLRVDGLRNQVPNYLGQLIYFF
jgi:hypothetical protein